MSASGGELSSAMPENIDDSSARSVLAEGLLELFKPCVEEIDDKVSAVRQSQVDLRQQIDSLAEDLRKVSDAQQVPVELEPYVKKLNNARRRVMLVNNIIQNAQERLGKLQQNISKETSRRKTLLQESPTGSLSK
ncbi:SNARE-associated protein Snapin [Lingula anatina]|uniref:Biogenesis of lysosome-related organelles complex 1 subunit 7 n=1 Tax=Lingula anatina TaxID=7574 RepID=A0A1S3JZF4_LINAN|nr:SNARE-associated protein Snapin [Lingula anatina]|eukprot:XP_013415783.1 SNARE-associated protein Snapin [Lingula anatina]